MIRRSAVGQLDKQPRDTFKGWASRHAAERYIQGLGNSTRSREIHSRVGQVDTQPRDTLKGWASRHAAEPERVNFQRFCPQLVHLSALFVLTRFQVRPMSLHFCSECHTHTPPHSHKHTHPPLFQPAFEPLFGPSAVILQDFERSFRVLVPTQFFYKTL
jgi:hypothetical protein